ncbi:hypothetical protein FPRO04_12453 [Fusarium proliferatum]|nr:hypothetical protein FPRO04_12453 [Fusarium proliferatum]
MKLAIPSLTNNATNPQREAPERDGNLRVQHAYDQDCLRVPLNSGVSPSPYLEDLDVDGGGDLSQTCDIFDWIDKVEKDLSNSEQNQATKIWKLLDHVSLIDGTSNESRNCLCVRENDKFLTLAINSTALYRALYRAVSQDPEILKSFGQKFKNNELCVAIRHIFVLLKDRGVSLGQVFRHFEASKPTMLTSEGPMLYPLRLDIKQVDNKSLQPPPLAPLPPDQKWDCLISAGLLFGKSGYYAFQDESPTVIIYKAAAAVSNMDKGTLTIDPGRNI